MPVNFGYDKAGKAFYFHGAAQGRKIDLIRQNGYAGFEMDTDHRLVTADEACGFSFEYSSIVGKGRITMVDDPEEKRHGDQAQQGQDAQKCALSGKPDALIPHNATSFSAAPRRR